MDQEPRRFDHSKEYCFHCHGIGPCPFDINTCPHCHGEGGCLYCLYHTELTEEERKLCVFCGSSTGMNRNCKWCWGKKILTKKIDDAQVYKKTF